MPWAGHLARHALGEVMAAIKAAADGAGLRQHPRQAELIFQDLWQINEDNLADRAASRLARPAQRRKVEAAMAAGRLRAVVCTSSLDLGIDWGAVDLGRLCRRAERRGTSDAAYRPRQSPDG